MKSAQYSQFQEVKTAGLVLIPPLPGMTH